ncbi:Poly [ADP-ribose] polymerase 2 [Nymphon striatum]|nr:Poly [ADP-ribose] polymerase 2 [Nymphon striatum]
MASESTKLMKNSHLLDFWIDLAFLKEKSYYAARNKQQLIRDFFLAEASKKQSTNYNVRNKVADASFMVGETVYWKRPPPAVTGSKKLLPVWQGPFTICGQLGPKTYIIEGDNGIKTTVNIDQLKKSQLPILLKFTSGPNAYNKEGRTPMLCAIANHYSIKELIEGSADINFPSRKKEDDSSTSLLLAARVKLTLRLLQNLQNGRDEAFSKLNIDNRKLLWHGTKLENVIGILSQELRVAPINAQLPSSKTGPVILLSLLFSKVQKFLSVSDVMGQVSQPYVRMGLTTILLEDLNCDPNAVEKCEDSTSLDTWNNSLHILASRGIFYALCRETSSFQPCSPILQGDLGIEGGADINLPSRKKEDDSSTSLLLAARVKHTLRLLQNLQNGRDEAFSKLNIDNRKLLWYGTKLENVIGILSQELRILLEDLNCDPNAVEKSEDSTSLDTWNNSLHILASRGIFYALPILLKFKSDPNAYNKEGRTPMLCAIANHYSIKELIEGGADINLPSRKKEDDSSTSLLLTARVKHTLRLLQNLQNGRNKAFSKLNIDNRKLLWHGTKLENVIGILSQELRVAPINAQL